MYFFTPSYTTAAPALQRLGLALIFSISFIVPTVFADNSSNLNYPLDPEYDLPLDELRSFAEVYERIKQAYVHDVDDRELLECYLA